MRDKIITLFTICVLAGGSAWAHNQRRGPYSIEASIREADAVVVGEVVDVQYASSKGDEQAMETLPHTFVTYKVRHVLKGSSNQETLSLRFLGGRGKEAQFMQVANSPLFDLGDMDVLFVKGNQAFSCPLLNCAEGRFRLINNRVYSEKGHSVWRTRKEQIAFGEVENLEPIMTHKVSQTVIRVINKEEPGEGKLEVLPIQGEPFSADSFIEFVKLKINQMDPNGAWRKLPVIPPANPKVAFRIKPLIPVAARLTAEQPLPRIKPTPDEVRERQLFERGEGNPVISQ